jgi:hypothetical protein
LPEAIPFNAKSINNLQIGPGHFGGLLLPSQPKNVFERATPILAQGASALGRTISGQNTNPQGGVFGKAMPVIQNVISPQPIKSQIAPTTAGDLIRASRQGGDSWQNLARQASQPSKSFAPTQASQGKGFSAPVSTGGRK